MECTVLAPAKINLGLEILGKNNDGYHNVEMVMQTVSLYDKVTVSVTSNGGINVICDKNINCEPTRNTAYRCATEFFEYTKIKNPGITIKIAKNIPMEAGLAGGSTDGAGTLIALNKIFNANLSNNELMNLGGKIGADIPFCIMKGTAIATGIGTDLVKISTLQDYSVVIVKPDFSISTKEAYEKSDSLGIKNHTKFDELVKALEEKNTVKIGENLFNRFESVISQKEIFYIKDKLINLGANGAIMSGSGSSVFGIFENSEKASNALEALKKEYTQVFLCRTISEKDYA